MSRLAENGRGWVLVATAALVVLLALALTGTWLSIVHDARDGYLARSVGTPYRHANTGDPVRFVP